MDKNTSYKITIIVPVYNTENWLKNCLDSLVNQSLKEIELLCINDGSTDNSPAILQEYAKNDSRITLINTSHIGIGPARNLALDNAKGEYIMFVDSDDWAEPNMCEIMYNTVINKNVDIVFCANTAWRDGAVLSQIPLSTEFKKRKLKIKPSDIFTFDDICNYNMVLMLTPWAKIFNRNFLQKNNIRFGNYSWGEDQIFNIHARLLAKMCYIDDFLYNYRKARSGNSGSLAQSFPIKEIYDDISNLYRSYNKEKYLDKSFLHWVQAFPVWGYKKLPENKRMDYLKNCKSFMTKAQYKLLKKRLGKDVFANTLKSIFSVENEYSNNNKYKLISVLGAKMKVKSWR